MIELNAITKTLGRKLILSNVSLSVGPGEIVGIAGPVGAGKSTLLNMCNGLISPDKGSVTIINLPMQTRQQQILQHINYASSNQRLSGYATVMENLATYALLYEIPDANIRITSFFRHFGIPAGLLHKKIYRLSSGENSLVNLAKAVLNNPKVLLLDEITAHMDPILTARVHEFLKKRNISTCVTVLVSQNTKELQSFCTRVIVLSRGRVVYDGKPLSPARIKIHYA